MLFLAPPEFVDDPSSITSDSRLYLPPSGHSRLFVVCSTKEKANITWLAVLSGSPSDLSVLNITQTTGKKSVLFEKNPSSSVIIRGTLIGLSFTCKAENDAGETTTTNPFEFRLGSERFYLSTCQTLHQSVLGLPTISKAPSNVTEQEGKGVMLNCSSALGAPSPQIFWTFVAKGSNATVNKQMSNNLQNNLVLPNIQRDEAGTYTCFVQNQFQTLSAEAVVIVTCMSY